MFHDHIFLAEAEEITAELSRILAPEVTAIGLDLSWLDPAHSDVAAMAQRVIRSCTGLAGGYDVLDYLPEIREFTGRLYSLAWQMGTNGGRIGSINLPTTAAANGVWSVDDVALNRLNGTWPLLTYTVTYLVVAGGGAGGGGVANGNGSGGGGAGGLLTSTTSVTNGAAGITVTVGAGGSGVAGAIGGNGSASVFGAISATGGGGGAKGGGAAQAGAAGGSGGGGNRNVSTGSAGGAGTGGQGNNGGQGGTTVALRGGGGWRRQRGRRHRQLQRQRRRWLFEFDLGSRSRLRRRRRRGAVLDCQRDTGLGWHRRRRRRRRRDGKHNGRGGNGGHGEHRRRRRRRVIAKQRRHHDGRRQWRFGHCDHQLPRCAAGNRRHGHQLGRQHDPHIHHLRDFLTMSHFAEIDENGVVLRVIVAEQDFIDSGRPWGRQVAGFRRVIAAASANASPRPVSPMMIASGTPSCRPSRSLRGCSMTIRSIGSRQSPCRTKAGHMIGMRALVIGGPLLQSNDGSPNGRRPLWPVAPTHWRRRYGPCVE
jgi:hypothetical protein